VTGAARATGGYQGWRDDWLAARPEWRLLEVFHPAAREPAAGVLEMLAQEWLDAGLSIREPDVARRKLAWWLDEIAELGSGRARHPLTTALADGPGLRDAAPILARAVGSALALVEVEAVASTASLVDATVPLAAALDEVGVALGIWRSAGSDRAPALAAALLGDLLRDWPRFARPERGLVPLALLARHGVDRVAAQSGNDAAACDALLRDLAGELRGTVGRGHRGDLAVGRLVIAGAWLDAVARDPRGAREGRAAPPRLQLLWAVWRAARGARWAGR
jgi:hypothetical protein